MSKLLSKEQIEVLFQKHLDDKVGSGTRRTFYASNNALEASARTSFIHAFTLLIPIIERQETALMEINDLLMDGKSMYIADRAKIAYKAIKETNRMLEKLREKSVDD